MSDGGQEAAIYECPHCHAEIQIDWAAEPFVRCPHCGEEFALPESAVTPQAAPDTVVQSDELDGNRIQQIVVQRRAEIRLRSYFLLGFYGCSGAAITFLYRIAQRLIYHTPWDAIATVQAVLAIIAIGFSFFFLMHARRITRELSKPLLSEPSSPPDFSQLSDGSQQAEALEDLS
jgi:ribosomal protein L37AE/L43A